MSLVTVERKRITFREGIDRSFELCRATEKFSFPGRGAIVQEHAHPYAIVHYKLLASKTSSRTFLVTSSGAATVSDKYVCV